jgi:hypothetical protein
MFRASARTGEETVASRSGWLMALIGVSVGVLVAADPARAAENAIEGLSIVAALSDPGDICARGRSRPELAMCEAIARPAPRQLAQEVTCAANEWCCRHDFAKKICVKCCPK